MRATRGWHLREALGGVSQHCASMLDDIPPQSASNPLSSSGLWGAENVLHGLLFGFWGCRASVFDFGLGSGGMSSMSEATCSKYIIKRTAYGFRRSALLSGGLRAIGTFVPLHFLACARSRLDHPAIEFPFPFVSVIPFSDGVPIPPAAEHALIERSQPVYSTSTFALEWRNRALIYFRLTVSTGRYRMGNRWTNHDIRTLLEDNEKKYREANGAKGKGKLVEKLLPDVRLYLLPHQTLSDAQLTKRINNWYGNNLKFRTNQLDRAPGGRAGTWTFRNVVSQYHKDRVMAMCAKLKEEGEAKKQAEAGEVGKTIAEQEMEVEDEEGNAFVEKGSGKKLPFYQPALSLVEAEVRADEEQEDEIFQLVDLWNVGPPLEVQQKNAEKNFARKNIKYMSDCNREMGVKMWGIAIYTDKEGQVVRTIFETDQGSEDSVNEKHPDIRGSDLFKSVSKILANALDKQNKMESEESKKKKKEELHAKLERDRLIAAVYFMNGARIIYLPDGEVIKTEELRKLVRQVMTVQYWKFTNNTNARVPWKALELLLNTNYTLIKPSYFPDRLQMVDPCRLISSQLYAILKTWSELVTKKAFRMMWQHCLAADDRRPNDGSVEQSTVKLSMDVEPRQFEDGDEIDIDRALAKHTKTLGPHAPTEKDGEEGVADQGEDGEEPQATERRRQPRRSSTKKVRPDMMDEDEGGDGDEDEYRDGKEDAHSKSKKRKASSSPSDSEDEEVEEERSRSRKKSRKGKERAPRSPTPPPSPPKEISPRRYALSLRKGAWQLACLINRASSFTKEPNPEMDALCPPWLSKDTRVDYLPPEVYEGDDWGGGFPEWLQMVPYKGNGVIHYDTLMTVLIGLGLLIRDVAWNVCNVSSIPDDCPDYIRALDVGQDGYCALVDLCEHVSDNLALIVPDDPEFNFIKERAARLAAAAAEEASSSGDPPVAGPSNTSTATPPVAPPRPPPVRPEPRVPASEVPARKLEAILRAEAEAAGTLDSQGQPVGGSLPPEETGTHPSSVDQVEKPRSEAGEDQPAGVLPEKQTKGSSPEDQQLDRQLEDEPEVPTEKEPEEPPQGSPRSEQPADRGEERGEVQSQGSAREETPDEQPEGNPPEEQPEEQRNRPRKATSSKRAIREVEGPVEPEQGRPKRTRNTTVKGAEVKRAVVAANEKKAAKSKESGRSKKANEPVKQAGMSLRSGTKK
ncbi:hypothetical protein SCHPADRAFT_944424 [Schizopora paradoxa]|uniref:Uncharacterized protein n=1 Tax=Schizopora paradoxa TaxID=27342 RepID=A0A0H2R9E4_9AGAM|nr:hypothetical protein SCHPADRAFT_944424 [Schizopora paradoxa]